jgi:hypothetical protein
MENLARKVLMGLLALAAVVTFSAGCNDDGDTTADNDRSHHSEYEEDDD